MVSLQLSKSLDVVWVNLGVAEPDVYMRCWGKPLRAFVDEVSCTVRSRLGVLITGLDSSWALTDPDAAADITRKIGSTGLRFLDDMHSLAAMERFLGEKPRVFPPESIYLAVVQWRLGKATEACETLERGSSAGSAWHVRIDDLAREIGCTRES